MNTDKLRKEVLYLKNNEAGRIDPTGFFYCQNIEKYHIWDTVKIEKYHIWVYPPSRKVPYLGVHIETLLL